MKYEAQVINSSNGRTFNERGIYVSKVVKLAVECHVIYRHWLTGDRCLFDWSWCYWLMYFSHMVTDRWLLTTTDHFIISFTITSSVHTLTTSDWLQGSAVERRSLVGELSVLHSTCSWRVTTYVGKPSATGQQPGQLSISSLGGRQMSSEQQLDVCYLD